MRGKKLKKVTTQNQNNVPRGARSEVQRAERARAEMPRRGFRQDDGPCLSRHAYNQSGLRDAFSRPDDARPACLELALLVRATAFARTEKALVSILTDDCRRAVTSPRPGVSGDAAAALEVGRAATAALPLGKAAAVVRDHAAHARASVRVARLVSKDSSCSGEDAPDEGTAATAGEDVLRLILSYLPPRDLAAAVCVCVGWRVAARDSGLWDHDVAAHFERASYGDGVINISHTPGHGAAHSLPSGRRKCGRCGALGWWKLLPRVEGAVSGCCFPSGNATEDQMRGWSVTTSAAACVCSRRKYGHEWRYASPHAAARAALLLGGFEQRDAIAWVGRSSHSDGEDLSDGDEAFEGSDDWGGGGRRMWQDLRRLRVASS